MDRDRWSLVKRLFVDALDVSAERRSAYLDELCGDDAGLKEEVASLLASHEKPEGPLDAPVWEAVELPEESWQGQRVAQYEVGEEIGRGGMGVVHAAKDVELRRQVALKFLSDDLAMDGGFLERFRREARAASSLNHPNVCTIYGLGDSTGHPYIAMELLQGRTLKQRLTEGPCSQPELTEWAIQAAEGLVAAHSAGIVHRDIKPANIFLTAQGLVKVLDFGLAKVDQETGPYSRGDDLTKPGLAVGTIAYMSPEQARGETLDARTDLFSFGAVLYEMATGQQPFTGATAALVLDAILNRTPVPPAGKNPAIPAALEGIIQKALEKDRDVRYQSAADLCADLKRLRRDSDPAIAAIRDGKSATTRRRFPLRIAVATLGLLLAIAGLLYWRTRAQAPLSSLAVLPLANSASDPAAEYLIDGVSESLMQRLSQLPRLRVMARSTVFGYKGKTVDPRRVGRDLRVQAVLTGSVREHGDEMVIQAELVNVSDGSRLWGAQYQRKRSDLQAVQEEIAAQIAYGLRLELSDAEQKRLKRRDSASSAAYQLYLQGRYFWSKRNAAGIQKAIDLFQQAVRMDPKFALAHVGLADCYIVLNGYGLMEENEAAANGEAAARMALSIDPALSEAHTSLAFIVGMHRWKFKEAETEYKKAIELNPSYATAHQWYSLHLCAMRRPREALVEIRRALDLDPVSLIIRSDYALVLLFAKEYDQAVRECARTLEMDPAFTTAHWYLGQVYTYKGEYDKAVDELQRGASSTFGEASVAHKVGVAYARWGKHKEALENVETLKRLSANSIDAQCNLASIYAASGDKKQALAALEQALQARAGCLVWIHGSPDLESLQTDPQFLAIEERVGFYR